MFLRVRPTDIVAFELFGYFTILFGSAVSTWANWQILGRFFNRFPLFYSSMTAASIIFQVFWIWMIAHKRQKWAWWVSAALLAASTIIVTCMIYSHAHASFQALIVATVFLSNSEIVSCRDPLFTSCVICVLWFIDLRLAVTDKAKAWFIFPAGRESEDITASVRP